jgi:hypothetical protein
MYKSIISTEKNVKVGLIKLQKILITPHCKQTDHRITLRYTLSVIINYEQTVLQFYDFFVQLFRTRWMKVES